MLVDDVRVRGVCRESVIDRHVVPTATSPSPTPLRTVSVYFDGGRRDTATYKSSSLTHGHVVPGPALVVDDTSTIVVEPGCVLTVSQYGDFIIDVPPYTAPATATSTTGAAEVGAGDVDVAITGVPPSVDLIKLSIFSHRYGSPSSAAA